MSGADALSAAPDWQSGYFDAMYGGTAGEDPYGVRSRWYEQRKRDLLLAALPKPRFQRAFEPACGIGELTAVLAGRCDELLAADFNARALQVAARRTQHLPQVRLLQQRLPKDWPADALAQPFELIVLSEIGYFLSEPELRELARRCRASLVAGGTLVACHWRVPFAERTLDTDRVHALLGGAMPCLCTHQEADFLLQVWSSDGRSVAQREHIW